MLPSSRACIPLNLSWQPARGVPGQKCCCGSHAEGKEGHREDRRRLPGAVGAHACGRKRGLKWQQPVPVFQSQQGSAVCHALFV